MRIHLHNAFKLGMDHARKTKKNTENKETR